MQRRSFSCYATAVAAFIVFSFLYHGARVRDSWRSLPQHAGLGEWTTTADDKTLSEAGSDSVDALREKMSPYQEDDYADWNLRPRFKPGRPLPADHNYSSVLVVAKTKGDDTSWMDTELGDQARAVYVADDAAAPLHPPKNKGHEVMVYLSWIIDNYDSLPDVAVFAHAHRFSWHNDDVLDGDAATMVRQLSRQRVWREGYVNLRCNWSPGCPDWMHPGETEQNAMKQEEVMLAKSWRELFPLDPVPSVLAQPCCAQFALSRERIQTRPQATYMWYRDWLFSTPLPDYLSGRIWEYVWQFVFTGEHVVCAHEHICLCDGYGMCFGGADAYDGFVHTRTELYAREADLHAWEEKRNAIDEARHEGRFDDAAQLDASEPGRDGELRQQIGQLRNAVQKLKTEARARGADARNRAFEAGRPWNEGDDF